ncbi:putative transcriptional regulatory protein [Mycobacterium tuberculosis RGTB327]|nr:putative transcriptional regulatory protein [Mycobacterium tuberculosis RGTB327]
MNEALDDIDRILVRELAADGRATLSELATRAGLSVSAVQSRVRRPGVSWCGPGIFGANQSRGGWAFVVGVRGYHSS